MMNYIKVAMSHHSTHSTPGCADGVPPIIGKACASAIVADAIPITRTAVIVVISVVILFP